MIYPPPLSPGDRVALVAPAGPVDEAVIQRAHERCRTLGLFAVEGEAIRRREGYLAGTDRERAQDLSRAITGDAAGIWALRGGYGALRTLEHVDLTPLRDRPKAFIGFSDNTAIHLAMYHDGLVSFHGPHAGFEDFPPTTEKAFRAVVMSGEPAGSLPLPSGTQLRTIAGGNAQGHLVGGNLSLMAAVCGTRHQPDTRGALVFLEDVAEPLYRIDRLLMQLRLAGLFDDVAGVALGRFGPAPETGKVEDSDEGAPDDPEGLVRLFRDGLADLGVPVALGLPFGHNPENWTLPLGVAAILDADAGTLELLEAATADDDQ